MATPRFRLRWFDDDLLATKAILFFCLLVFGVGVAIDHRLPLAAGAGGSFSPVTLFRLGVLFPSLLPFEPWRVVSAVFVHFDALHIGLNLWGVVTLGPLLERRFGAGRALLLFWLSGVLGFCVSTWWYGVSSGPPTAGASGGVFGQLGALIGVLVYLRQPGWKDLFVQNLAYAAVMGFMFSVNNAAHAGGFVCGFGLGYLFEMLGGKPRTLRIWNVCALLVGLVSVAAQLACFESRALADDTHARYENPARVEPEFS